MGGSGSGGHNSIGRPKVDGSRHISINDLTKKGSIPACGMIRGSWTWTDDYSEDSTIGFEVNTTDPHNPFLRLYYSFKDSGENMDYKIALTRTVPQYGGSRWWFICPGTGRRVTKLYLPYGDCKR